MKKLHLARGAAVITSTLATTHPTLLDLKSQLNPDGSVAGVIEILDQDNEIHDDLVVLEGNLPTGHRGSVRTGICEPAFRKLYGRVQPARGTHAQVTDNCGMMVAYPEVDAKLAELSGDIKKFRYNQEMAHIQGFNQKLARYLFYGNEATEPEGFTGLAPRFNSLSAENACNILAGSANAGSNVNTSIWLVCFSPISVHAIFPKGSKAGITVVDKGLVTSENSDGLMEVYRSNIQWDCGLHLADWRYAVRIQVDASALTKNAATGADLLDLMAQAIDLLPNTNIGRTAFYANRTVRGFIRRQIMNKTVNSTLSIEQITRANGAHIHVPMFDGIPIRRVDQLLNTEAKVGA